MSDNSKHNLETTDSNDDECCPVCLNNPSKELKFAFSQCDHQYCIPCAERILLTSKPRNPHLHVDEIPDAHLFAPTLGRCPICRQELSLFQLKDEKNGKALYEKDEFVSKGPLAGCVFQDRKQELMLVFPFNKKDNTELPYLRFSRDPAKFDNGEPTPDKCYFDKGCHFHAKSCTFHGTLTWAKNDTDETTYLGSEGWECIFQFSSDFRFICSGTIVKHLRKLLHPFDGSWLVRWMHDGTTSHIDVKASEMRLGYLNHISFVNPKKPCFRWPDFGDGEGRVVQSVDYDLEAHPNGPAAGESIIWNTTHLQQNRIQWTRETVTEPPSFTVTFLGPGDGCTLFKAQVGFANNGEERQPPSYVSNTLWGNTFCQGFKVGLASYHFVDNEEQAAYISYENPATGHWPPLDNGSPVPARVEFHETVYDANERIFCGKIKWNQDYDTSWQGCHEWLYEMKFDTEFTCIVSGTVLSKMGEGDEDPKEMSTFGNDLVYINASIDEKLGQLFEGAETTGDDNNEIPIESFRDVSDALVQRLQNEGASVRTIAMMRRACLAQILPGDAVGGESSSQLVDFNL